MLSNVLYKARKNKKGFTLIELMVVVAIIGVLVAIAVPAYTSVIASAKERACQANEKIIESAVEIYKADNNGNAPSNIDDLLGDYLKEIPECPFETGDGTDSDGDDYSITGECQVVH